MIDRKTIEGILYKEFDNLEANNFAVLGRPEDPMWDRPLIGVAAGDDPYFDFLKMHIGEIYWSPADVFEKRCGRRPERSDLSVISMAFPQTEATKKMQNKAVDYPSDDWLVTRGEWEPLIRTYASRVPVSAVQLRIC